jgi:single-strand DNA-binding protein
MAGINKVILVGNLGKDPEIRNLENGVKTARFSLATTESYRDREGNQTEHTEWHNITLWRGLAGVAEQYLKKGNSVYIEGRLRTREWQDKEGNKRYTTEILCDNMVMLGGKRADQPAPVASKSGPAVPEPEENGNATPEDDLPF